MKGAPDDVLKAIPDFDEFMKLSASISDLMYKKMRLDNEIKGKEAEVFKLVSTSTDFLQAGKPPSATYIDNTYKFSGINGELLPLRDELSKTISDLEGKKQQMEIYKTMIEVWRTLCSNARTAGL